MPKLEQLRMKGRAQPALSAKQPAPEPVRTRGTVSDLVVEQRGNPTTPGQAVA